MDTFTCEDAQEITKENLTDQAFLRNLLESLQSLDDLEKKEEKTKSCLNTLLQQIEEVRNNLGVELTYIKTDLITIENEISGKKKPKRTRGKIGISVTRGNPITQRPSTVPEETPAITQIEQIATQIIENIPLDTSGEHKSYLLDQNDLYITGATTLSQVVQIFSEYKKKESSRLPLFEGDIKSTISVIARITSEELRSPLGINLPQILTEILHSDISPNINDLISNILEIIQTTEKKINVTKADPIKDFKALSSIEAMKRFLIKNPIEVTNENKLEIAEKIGSLLSPNIAEAIKQLYILKESKYSEYLEKDEKIQDNIKEIVSEGLQVAQEKYKTANTERLIGQCINKGTLTADEIKIRSYCSIPISLDSTNFNELQKLNIYKRFLQNAINSSSRHAPTFDEILPLFEQNSDFYNQLQWLSENTKDHNGDYQKNKNKMVQYIKKVTDKIWDLEELG